MIIFDDPRSNLRQQDEFVYDEIFNWNVYELKNFEVKDQNVLDIGCHFGMFTLFAHDLGAKQIISVDADPINFSRFLKNTVEIKNLKAINVAVTSRTGDTVTIDSKGCQTAINTGTVTVGTVSLYDIVGWFPENEKIILKMDIEGAEYDVIRNAPREVFDRFSIITMEIHSEKISGLGNHIDDLINYIIGLGFKVIWKGTFFTDTPQGRMINPDIVVVKFIR